MKSLLVAIALSLFASTAFGCAATSSASEDAASSSEALRAAAAELQLQSFTCKTDRPVDGKVREIAFLVKNLNGSHMEIHPPTGLDDSDDEPVKVTPAGSRLSSINENLDFGIGERTFHIRGDSDGFFDVDFRLYKDGGFEKGYVRIAGEGGDAYAEVSCRVAPFAARASS